MVVQNGEIYNHAELRAELERARARASATRIRHRGARPPLRGAGRRASSSACAGCSRSRVWDAAGAGCVLARDRFGIKPLYYRDGAGRLSFASELKALRRLPGFSRDIDLDALEAFLAFNAIPGRCTIFREVRKLPPGHVLVREGGEPRARALRLDPRPAAGAARRAVGGAGGRAARAPARLRARPPRRRRPRRRAALGRDRLLARSPPSRPRESAARGLRRSRSASRSARSTSSSWRARSRERYGTDHHELDGRARRRRAAAADRRRLRRAVRGLLGAADLPRLRSSPREHVKVALSGEGGDELFGGYETYVADQLALVGGGAARLLSPLAERLPSGRAGCRSTTSSSASRAPPHLPPLERHHGWKEIFSPDARAALLRPERRGTEDPLDVYRARWAETEGADTLARLQDVDRRSTSSTTCW